MKIATKANLMVRIEELNNQISQKSMEISRLKDEIDWLKRHVYTGEEQMRALGTITQSVAHVLSDLRTMYGPVRMK